LRDGFDEVITNGSVGYGAGSYLELCFDRSFELGQQAFLPINDSVIIYDREVWVPGDPGEWRDHVRGHEVKYLLFGDSTFVVTKYIELQLEDTILNQLADYTSDGLGGWWGIVRSCVSDRFHVFHYTADSSYHHSVQRVGPAGFSRERNTTRMRFNPGGTAFVIVGGDDGVAFYDFDRATAAISLREVIPYPDPDWVPYRNTHDVDWSADGRFVYMSYRPHVYQFDTQAGDLFASAVQLDTDDPDTDNIPYYRTTRGPDCRIYVAIPGAAKWVSVIDKPQKKGRAAELYPAGIELQTIYFVGMPEFPNYALWAKDRLARGEAPLIDTAVCDSSIIAFPYINWSPTREVPEAEWVCYPNPVRSNGELNLRWPVAPLPAGRLRATLYDHTARAVANFDLGSPAGTSMIQLPQLPAGVYTLALGSGGLSLGVQRIMVTE
jgi:hypothetical protein